MELCKTDIQTIARLMEAASAFYKQHAKSARDVDRSRILMNMSDKLYKKLNHNDKK